MLRLSRGEVMDGALEGRGLELVWLEDPVDAFFLHVQGSGRVRLEDGSTLRLGYAGRNAHDYASIGKLMKRDGLFERVDAQVIRDWATRNPAKGAAYFRKNPSYIFFRVVPGLDEASGPVGAMGQPLTAMRSLAVDPSFTPLGAPVWIEAEGIAPRLTVAQDVGSAIKGPQRADLFVGTGDAAGEIAGAMQAKLRMTVLLPTRAAARLVAAR